MGGSSVLRFLANGSLDSTFGTNGVFELGPLGTSAVYGGNVHDAALQSDGKIVIVGDYISSQGPAGYGATGGIFLLRLNASAGYDTGFGAGGSVYRELNLYSSGNIPGSASSVLIQSDGKILVGGGGKVSISRYNSDGSLDAGFGQEGDISIPFPRSTITPSTGVVGMAFQSPGRLVVGIYPGLHYDFFNRTSTLLRYSIQDVSVSKSQVVTSESGRSDSFTVVLERQPTADVVLVIGSSDTSEGTVSFPTPSSPTPATMIFTPANYNIPQTVNVIPADDTESDPDQSYSVVILQLNSADPSFNGLDPQDIQATNYDNETLRMLRSYNPNADYHFFTTSTVQFDNAVQHGYRDEATGRSGFSVYPGPGIDRVPLYRLYNFQTGRHYYTTNAVERQTLLNIVPPNHPSYGTAGWRDEGIEGYMPRDPTTGTTPIYRLYNNNSGTHLFTESAGTRDAILAAYPGVWVEHAPLGYGLIATTGGSGQSQPAVSAPAIAEPALPVAFSESDPASETESQEQQINGVETPSAGTSGNSLSQTPSPEAEPSTEDAVRADDSSFAPPESLDTVFAASDELIGLLSG